MWVLCFPAQLYVFTENPLKVHKDTTKSKVPAEKSQGRAQTLWQQLRGRTGLDKSGNQKNWTQKDNEAQVGRNMDVRTTDDNETGGEVKLIARHRRQIILNVKLQINDKHGWSIKIWVDLTD